MKMYLLLLLLLAMTVPGLCRSEYKVVNTVKNASSVELTLSYTGQDEYYVKPTSPIVKTLKFLFLTHTYSDFIVKITDAQKSRFEVPQNNIIPTDPMANFTYPIYVSAISFEYTETPFDFKITRKDNGAILFSTYDKILIFSEHYLEIGTEVNSPYIYGFGERFSANFRIKDGKWTMFTRQRGFQLDDGTEGKNAYGYYPFYWLRQKGDLFHINYLRSSNAMDVLKSTQNGKHYLTYKVIGGVFDFRFILGQSKPQVLLARYNQFYGENAVPPFWALGFHQCRWGYENITFLTDVIENYQKNKIPLDAVWSDADYMIDFEVFTVDTAKFPPTEIAKIRQKYKWVPIIDSGIKTTGYAYQQGLKRGVFTKDANGSNYIGRVWPGGTVFVDYFHPNSTQYWIDMLDSLYSKVQYDGIWLDMNEIDNFCNGPCIMPTEPKVFDYSHDLPYNPGKDGIQNSTISMNCTHYGNLSEADVHIFHSLMQSHASNLFFKKKNKQPFFITRSTTIGSARYGFHWTGDNNADWSFLRGSINHVLNNQLFGMYMVGSDICGFSGEPSEELCSRWYQLGAMYPFARSHNMFGYPGKEPYSMGHILLEAAKKAIQLRYSLMKHIYTQTILGSESGEAMWKPLFFLFPIDPKSYEDEIAQTEFMFSDALLLAPIVEEGKTSRSVYLPLGAWFEYHKGRRYQSGTHEITGYELTDMIPMFLREGSLVLAQSISQVGRSADLNNRFSFVAAFRFNKERTNITHKCYTSFGRTLSIKDYNDKEKVEQCAKTGCYFNFTLELSVSEQEKVLEIFGAFKGDNMNLREFIWIDKMTLYYEDNQINYTPPQSIDIQQNIYYNKIIINNSEPQNVISLQSE